MHRANPNRWSTDMRGFGVDDWLRYFFDPDNYPDQRCALFADGKLIGFRDNFAEAVRESFLVSDKRVRFAVVLLSPPFSNLKGHRKEQTDIVRKSMDAVFVQCQRYGNKNDWANTVNALLSQAEAQFLKASYQYFMNLRRCQHDRKLECKLRRDIEDHLEVGFAAIKSLSHYSENNDEIRSIMFRCFSQLSPFKRVISEACLQIQKTGHDVGLKGVELTPCERLASEMFLALFEFAKESDNVVAAVVARKYLSFHFC